MKKIFTLLICLMGMTFAANATDVQDCINYLLSHHGEAQRLNTMNANFDANQDGVVNISDVTFMINENLRAQQTDMAPARNTDIPALINEVLETETENPNIEDVAKAIKQNLDN